MKKLLLFLMAAMMMGGIASMQGCQDDLKEIKNDVKTIRELCEYVMQYGKSEVERGSYDNDIWYRTRGRSDQYVIGDLKKYCAPQWLIDYVLNLKHQYEADIIAGKRDREGYEINE